MKLNDYDSLREKLSELLLAEDLEVVLDALCLVQTLHSVCVENGRVSEDADVSTDALEDIFDMLMGEVTASVLLLDGLNIPPENINEAATQIKLHDTERVVPKQVLRGFRTMSKRLATLKAERLKKDVG